MKQIKLNVNGLEYSVLINPHWTLLDVLRDEIGLMGTKKGCDKGECGVCTVIMSGEAILSCLVLAIQCGFCTPGMIIASRALLNKTPYPSEEEIKRGLSEL